MFSSIYLYVTFSNFCFKVHKQPARSNFCYCTYYKKEKEKKKKMIFCYLKKKEKENLIGKHKRKAPTILYCAPPPFLFPYSFIFYLCFCKTKKVRTTNTENQKS